MAEMQAVIQKRSLASERRISKDHGVQSWKTYYLGSITALPFFVTAIQGVRRLCGAGGGIFGLFSNPLPGFAKAISGKEVAEGVSSTPSTTEPAVGHPPWNSEVPQVDSSAAAAPAASQTPLNTELLGYEPSLSTGGCLWFPDLTVQDPYHVLPFMLSATMLWVVLPKTLEHTRQLLDPMATNLSWRTRLHRALLVISLAIGPLTMHLPAAMHLYWISSTLIATAQREVVHKILKLPRNDYQRPKGRDALLVQPPPPPPPSRE
jgi:inner membrane protein COX18